MKTKNISSRLTAVILTVIITFSAVFSTASAATILSKKDRDEYRLTACDRIVDVAREQIGFYESNVNKFTTWYFGYETDAYWCSIFVSWCADQIGAIDTAVPKRSACGSMRNWFELRGEYYPVKSDYVPQKGDIIFINTEVDGTDDIHHVEIVTESGFLGSESNPKVKCIGGNTSDLNYNGSEYVTEKVRPVNGSRAQVVGYAHPSYEKSMGVRGKVNTFSEKTKLPFFKLLQSKLISLLYNMEILWDNFTMSVEMSVQRSNENLKNAFTAVNERFDYIKIKPDEVQAESEIEVLN